MFSLKPFSAPSKEENCYIIWVSMDNRYNPVHKHCSTSIRHYPALTPEHLCPPWFRPENIQRIRAVLGAGFAYANSKLRALQQGVVTVEILTHQYPCEVMYLESPDAACEYLLSISYTEKKKTLVWLDAHQDVHPHEWMHAYDTLTNECGSIFPPREEIVFADFKIYDMQAFDRIASETGAYRPLTCYPGAQDRCLLSKGRTSVLKRSHSCCSSHVKIIDADLRCKPPCEKPPLTIEDDSAASLYRWMHQEYVPSLAEFGEFRVFVATEAGKDRVRQPYIVHVIRTKWVFSQFRNCGNPLKEPLGDEYQAVQVMHDEHWPQYPDLNYDELTRFALHVYRQLQKSGELGFQSLNVGGRLDIGVSPDGKQFFVNELTRWYGAHQFAIETQEPHQDRICRAHAKAFAEVLGKTPCEKLFLKLRPDRAQLAEEASDTEWSSS